MLASRAALIALALLAGFSSTEGTAVARREPTDAAPSAQPTPTPIYIPLTPPPSGSPAPVATPQLGIVSGNQSCRNDQLLAVRAIPQPWEADVSVCAYVTSVSGPGSFTISVDGTQPLPVEGANLPAVHPGDKVIVRGRYHRLSSGAEKIEVSSPSDVSLIPASQ